MIRRFTITATFTSILAVALLAGCGEAPEDELRDAVPTASELSFTIPAGAQQAQSEAGKKVSALLGARAELYNLTYNVTHDLNGSVWKGLHVIESIVRHRPSAVSANHAVWGPHTPPLEPLTGHREVVEHLGGRVGPRVVVGRGEGRQAR